MSQYFSLMVIRYFLLSNKIEGVDIVVYEYNNELIYENYNERESLQAEDENFSRARFLKSNVCGLSIL